MADLAATFQEFGRLFRTQRFQPFGNSTATRLLHVTAPEQLQQMVADAESYKIYGSVGVGQWAEIPWVAVLDKDISTTTQKGYYLVYLFDKQLEQVYLSLGLGYVQFELEYGVMEARTQIQAVANHYAGLLIDTVPGFTPGLIELGADNNLGKGYERGAVLAKRYTLAELDEAELLADLQAMLTCYQELKAIVGDSVLNIDLDTDADQYDNTVQTFQKEITTRTYHAVDETIIDALLEQTETYPRQVRAKLVKQIVRNRKIATLIKEKSHYICALCGREPFIQKNGRPYAEADHIIPLGGKTKGADSAANLRCLCAQCHAVITHGLDEEIAKLL